jgi:hypothetical protein
MTGRIPPGKRGRREIGTARTSRYLCSGLLGIRCPDEESALEADDDDDDDDDEESGMEEEASLLASPSF